MNKTSQDTALLEEIWQARREIENEYDNDLDKIYSAYVTNQLKHPSDYYSGKPVMLQGLKAA